MNKRYTISPKRTKKGSFTVEAAIVAPLFFLALAAVIFLIRLDLQQEAFLYDLTEEAKQAAYLAHYLPLEEDGGMRAEFYRTETLSVPVPFPFFRQGRVNFRETLRFRGFVGLAAEGTPLAFEEMERESSDDLVWIFPRRGERYHKRECRIVTVYPEERHLTASLRRTYDGCQNCKPETLENGTPVYCFATGKVYHSRECSAVERYVVSIAKSQAEEQGYSACSYCKTADE